MKAEELKIPSKDKNSLRDFIQSLKEIYQQELVSLILYGSGASGEFIDKRSNLNLLVVLQNTDLKNLKKASKAVNKSSLLRPLFLSEDYILSSLDIFPIEFLDMQENYLVLYGKDVLGGLNIEIKNLRFQCEQELKAKLLNLRQLYLKINRDRTALRNLLFKSFTSSLHILRNTLRLKGRKPSYQKQEILGDLLLEFQLNKDVWGRILAARNKQIKLSGEDIEGLFIAFVRDLEKIVEVIDRL